MLLLCMAITYVIFFLLLNLRQPDEITVGEMKRDLIEGWQLVTVFREVEPLIFRPINAVAHIAVSFKALYSKIKKTIYWNFYEHV